MSWTFRVWNCGPLLSIYAIRRMITPTILLCLLFYLPARLDCLLVCYVFVVAQIFILLSLFFLSNYLAHYPRAWLLGRMNSRASTRYATQVNINNSLTINLQF